MIFIRESFSSDSVFWSFRHRQSLRFNH